MIPDRTAERITRIRGDVTPPPQTPAAAPRPQRADLGPNQLAWLREKVSSFAGHERQALDSEAHRQKLLDAVRP